jgi:hypothetical protein
MTLVIRISGLLLCGALATLGRWVYLHPEQFLEKFNPYGKPYSKFARRNAQFAGALWLFCIVLLASLGGW